MPITGNTATLAFGTSSFAAPIVNFSMDGRARAALDASTLATTNDRVFIPEELVDNGEVSVTCQLLPGEMAPISADPETITITMPASGSGVTTQGSYAFIGFITSDGGITVENGTIVQESYTIKIASGITFTDEVSS